MISIDRIILKSLCQVIQFEICYWNLIYDGKKIYSGFEIVFMDYYILELCEVLKDL